MDLTTLLYFILYLTLSLLFFYFIGYVFFKLTQNWQSSRKLEEQNEKNELSTTTLTSKFSTLLTGWLNDEGFLVKYFKD
jgi:ABC-type sulfate transport system permease component